jgi:hypothetical protein
MQNGQNPRQLLSKPLTKFGSVKQKIFLAKAFGFYEILFRFTSSITKIICST